MPQCLLSVHLHVSVCFDGILCCTNAVIWNEWENLYVFAAIALLVWKSSNCMQDWAMYSSFCSDCLISCGYLIGFPLCKHLFGRGAPEVRGPPWTQLRPLSPSPSLGMLSRMPTLTPTCLLCGMYFCQLLGQWGLNMRQDMFLSTASFFFF